MQFTEAHTVCQLRDEITSKTLTVKIDWHNTHFELLIFDGIHSYSGIMEEGEIIKVITQLGTITIDEYMKESRIALTNSEVNNDFVYRFDDNKIFQWKKVEFEMRITFGSILMVEAPVIVSLNDILNVLITRSSKLEEEVTRLNEQNNLLEISKRELLLNIDTYASAKTDVETELFSKFLVVLNSKKERINQLQKIVKANKIDVSNVSYLEEDTKSTINDLYECDTEIETNSENTDDEATKSVETMSKPKTFHTLSDSDSDGEKLICNIPKRNIRNAVKGQPVERSLQNESGYMVKPNKCTKLTSKRGNDQTVEQAGPSGMKISKTIQNKTTECDRDDAKDKETNFQKNETCILKNSELKETDSCTIKSSVDDILAGLIA